MAETKSRVLKLENIKSGFFENKKIFAVIGFFDGVHIAHRMIISGCIENARAKNGLSLAFTFDNPPANIIKGKIDKKLITSFSDKIKLLKETGLDFIVIAKFNKGFSQLSPLEFCKEILLQKLNVSEIFVGRDFKFGRNASGDVKFLEDFFNEKTIKVNVVDPIKINNIKVSSTEIRKFYLSGDIDKIIIFLGRLPSIKGTVVHGDKRGRLLGYPTANIDIFEKYIALKDGVYVGLVKLLNKALRNLILVKPLNLNNEINKRLNSYLNTKINKKIDLKINDVGYPSIINIGNNPTFNGKRKWVEAHILNFNNDIYGKRIEISFIKRLRDEIIFKNKSDLINQIKKDLSEVKKFFNSFS